MIAASDNGPERFQLLANFLAGRPLEVLAGRAGEPSWTEGQHVYVSPGRPPEEQRWEVIVQAALLGAGSLDPEPIRALRGRPRLTQRYLALEGRRVVARLDLAVPRAPALEPAGEPITASVDESVALAGSRRAVPAPPEWFGTLRPARLLRTPRQWPTSTDKDKGVEIKFSPSAVLDADEDGDEDSGRKGGVVPLTDVDNPTTASLYNFLEKRLGLSRSPGRSHNTGGGEVTSIRRLDTCPPGARPLPVPISFGGEDDAPRAAPGVGGALYPEWDERNKRYRPEWCRVNELSPDPAADISGGAVVPDKALRQRLARLGLGPKVLRRRPDGDDFDVEALIDLAIDVHAGHSPSENIYLERRKLARNLGVLILVDASGSATERDSQGRSVHEHQRRAAATLAVTFEELGDRVAVYGFRSFGRAAVQFLTVKPFGQRFGASGRAQLNRLEPSGYTRLGAALRHAGEVLKRDAGTPNRLLLVLSDGFPYDDGYESRHAEADCRRALEEVRADGIACLCLSISSSTPPDSLGKVFNSASHAHATTLAELSPRIDELFLGALRELGVSQRRVSK